MHDNLSSKSSVIKSKRLQNNRIYQRPSSQLSYLSRIIYLSFQKGKQKQPCVPRGQTKFITIFSLIHLYIIQGRREAFFHIAFNFTDRNNPSMDECDHGNISNTGSDDRVNAQQYGLKLIWQSFLKSFVVILIFTSSIAMLIGTLLVYSTSVKRSGISISSRNGFVIELFFSRPV